MPTNRFVPDDFEVPVSLETNRFRLRMLSVDDVEKDYEAVIESRELLHTIYGTCPWPKPGFTLEENLVDLKRHQEEFLSRKAFAYTVVSLDETKVLGCVYMNPPENSRCRRCCVHVGSSDRIRQRTGRGIIQRSKELDQLILALQKGGLPWKSMSCIRSDFVLKSRVC